MTRTIVASATKEIIIGFDQPFCVIGERINPTGRKKLGRVFKISGLVKFCAQRRKIGVALIYARPRKAWLLYSRNGTGRRRLRGFR